MYGRLGSVVGLGLAYAGSCREDLLEILVPFVVSSDVSVEQSALSALSLGLVFCGSCNEDAATSLLETLMERDYMQLNMTMARFFSVALALIFMG